VHSEEFNRLSGQYLRSFAEKRWRFKLNAVLTKNSGSEYKNPSESIPKQL